METIEIVLDRNQIEAILNGERINIKVNDIDISIRESYLLPFAVSPIERPIKAVDTNNNAVINKQYFNHLQNSALIDANK